tara:strand:- start:9330 stop:9662 length:333 start_codon:yes stop_codon:yes gene_type:complete
MTLYIRFFKDENSKEHLVVCQENSEEFKLLPYTIWQSTEDKTYCVEKIYTWGADFTKIDYVLTHKLDKNFVPDRFGTLKEAKKYIIDRVHYEYEKKIANHPLKRMQGESK